MKVNKNNLPEEISVGRAEDLRGQQFGDLTVLYRIKPPNKKTSIIWLCKCSCGEYCTAYSNNLKRGKVHSCGHDASNKFQDLTGETFGRLTVVKRAPDIIEKDTHSVVAWYCSCSCGNPELVVVRSMNLKLGLTQSCGCIHHEVCSRDIFGQRFGKLTAQYPVRLDEKTRNWIWSFRCDCGSQDFQAVLNSVTSGHTQSCGCDISRGENKIKKILEENNIDYKPQATFDDCRFPHTGFMARYDFCIFDNNQTIIEFDGPQHFFWNNTGYFTEEVFAENRKRDIFKNYYCFTHCLPIKRIPFTQVGNIVLNDLKSDSYIIRDHRDYVDYVYKTLSECNQDINKFNYLLTTGIDVENLFT